MNRPAKVITSLAIMLVAWAGTVALVTVMVKEGIKDFGALAIWQGPGKTTITVDEPGEVKVWNDYQTFFDGVTVSNPEALPSGFSFAATLVGSSQPIPLRQSRLNEEMSVGVTQRVAIGSFSLPSAGDYEITVGGPAGETRVFSVARSGVASVVAKMLLSVCLAGLLALVGVAALIFAIVAWVKEPKPLPPVLPT